MFYIEVHSKFAKQRGPLSVETNTMLLNLIGATLFISKEEAEETAKKVVNGIFTSYTIRELPCKTISKLNKKIQNYHK